MSRKRSTLLVISLSLFVVAAGTGYYSASRVALSAGDVFAVPGAVASSGTPVSVYAITRAVGTDVVLVASFVPSRNIRVRSIAVPGLDGSVATLTSGEYVFLSSGALPEIDPNGNLPLTVAVHPLGGPFDARANIQVIVRLVYRTLPDGRGRRDLAALRVVSNRLGRTKTDLVPFPAIVRLELPSG